MFKKYKKIIGEGNKYFSKQNSGENGIYKVFNVKKNTKYRIVFKNFKKNQGTPKIWIANSNNKQIFLKNLDNPYFYNIKNRILKIGLIFTNTKLNYGFSIQDINILGLSRNNKNRRKNVKKNMRKNNIKKKVKKKVKKRVKKKIRKKRKNIEKKVKGKKIRKTIRKTIRKKIKKRKNNTISNNKNNIISNNNNNNNNNNNSNVGKILSKYFDHIYLINLDKDTQRLKRIEKIFGKLNIKFERFNAVDGKKIKNYKKIFREPWNSWEKGMSRAAKIKRPSILGCLLSHRKIVRNALKKGYKKILIFEDDVIPNKSIKKLLVKNRGLLRRKWKLIYLGSTQHDWGNIEFQKNYYYANGTDGCFAYGMGRGAFREFLRLTKKPKYPVDYYMRYFQERYNCPVLYPQAFIAKLDQSRLRRKRNIKIVSRQFRWNLRNFDV